MESPRDCWSTGVVQNVAKLGIWGRIDLKEGKTSGYLVQSRLREKESEMEKNQVCDGQERPFCYEQRKISRVHYRHFRAGRLFHIINFHCLEYSKYINSQLSKKMKLCFLCQLLFSKSAVVFEG